MRLAGAVLAIAGCQFAAGSGSGTRPGDAATGDAARADARRLDAMVDGPASTADAGTSFLIQAEQYTTATATASHAWMPVTDIAGYSGTALMQILPNDGAACTVTEVATCATYLGYDLAITAPGNYFVYVRMWADTTADDSVWYGFDGAPDATPLQPAHDSTWHWMAGASFPLTAGTHTFGLWQREAGARADVVAVTTSATPPP